MLRKKGTKATTEEFPADHIEPIAIQCNTCGLYSTDSAVMKEDKCPKCEESLTPIYSGGSS